MELVRETVPDLDTAERASSRRYLFRTYKSLNPRLLAAESTAEFIDALFNVLTYINVHQATGHVLTYINVHQATGRMVIGAGIGNVLPDFVKISSRGDVQMVVANKAIVILDGFLNGYTNAVTAFIAADGSLRSSVGSRARSTAPSRSTVRRPRNSKSPSPRTRPVYSHSTAVPSSRASSERFTAS